MNGAQRAAFKRMVAVAEMMANTCFNLKQRALADLKADYWERVRSSMGDLQQQWDEARNRYFELENEAREAKKSAQGRTRKRGNSRESASSAR